MSALPLASARFSKLRIPFLNHLLDGDLCKISVISIFSLFAGFQSRFCRIVYIDFTHVAASNAATDDVAN